MKVDMRKDGQCACLSMQKSRGDVTWDAETISSCPEQNGKVIVTVKRKPLWNDCLSETVTR